MMEKGGCAYKKLPQPEKTKKKKGGKLSEGEKEIISRGKKKSPKRGGGCLLGAKRGKRITCSSLGSCLQKKNLGGRESSELLERKGPYLKFKERGCMKEKREKNIRLKGSKASYRKVAG